MRSSVEYFPFASTFWENRNYLGLLFSKKWTWLRKNQFLALIYLIWKSHILVAIVSTFPIKVDPKNLTWQQKHVAKDNKGQQAKKCHQKRTHWFKEAKLANNIFFTYTMNTSNISTLDFNSIIHHPPSRRNVHCTNCKSITRHDKLSPKLSNHDLLQSKRNFSISIGKNNTFSTN